LGPLMGKKKEGFDEGITENVPHKEEGGQKGGALANGRTKRGRYREETVVFILGKLVTGVNAERTF